MKWEDLLPLLLGSGGFVGLLSLVFTRKQTKEKHDLDVFDRTQKELLRADADKRRLEEEKRTLEREIDEKEDLLRHNEFERKKLISELDRVLWELEAAKNETERLRNKVISLKKEREKNETKL